MRIYIQRPYLSIHSNYPTVETIRAQCQGRGTIRLEVWAGDCPEEGIKYMENGITTNLTLEQAEELAANLNKAIEEARE